MAFRTDLAIEFENAENLGIESYKRNDINISKINIKTEYGEEKFKRQKGVYITLEFPDIMKMISLNNLKNEIIKSLSELLPKNCENLLIVGLGNNEITCDSIGPRVASKILATRHIAGNFAENIGLKGLKSISVIAPSVLGKTGIEAFELIKAITEKIKPQAIIVIDALAAGSVKRVFKTVQLTNSGIAPGSGVKNSRKEISIKTLGIPVVAVGVPTVVEAGIIAEELSGNKNNQNFDMILTPKDSDILCEKLSQVISEALNLFIQPDIDGEIIMSLV